MWNAEEWNNSMVEHIVFLFKSVFPYWDFVYSFWVVHIGSECCYAVAAPVAHRKTVMMAEDASSRSTLDPVGMALLHKSVEQHFIV